DGHAVVKSALDKLLSRRIKIWRLNSFNYFYFHALMVLSVLLARSRYAGVRLPTTGGGRESCARYCHSVMNPKRTI
ncbi:MAG: hypothetical protein PVJ13_07140, partial [Desulfobacterales bacterium]